MMIFLILAYMNVVVKCLSKNRQQFYLYKVIEKLQIGDLVGLYGDSNCTYAISSQLAWK